MICMSLAFATYCAAAAAAAPRAICQTSINPRHRPRAASVGTYTDALYAKFTVTFNK